MKQKKTVYNPHILKVVTIVSILVNGLILNAWTQTPQPRTLRVCVYENSPKIFTSESGKVDGFWPVLIENIALAENWQIEWVHGTWDECLTRLENNEIDLVPDMGWTQERSQKFTLSTETILTSWARVYVAEDSDVETILDLEGKSIAGLSGSLNFDGPEGIKVLIEKFDVQSQFVEKDSYIDVFKAIQAHEVDAGVANKDFGNLYEQQYHLTRTPIIIQPTKLHFAYSKTGPMTPYLLESIDLHVRAYKNQANSIYYQAMDQYLGENKLQSMIEIIPDWVYILLASAGCLILFLGAVYFTTSAQVHKQTTLIRANETRMRALLENIPDLIFRMTGEGKILDFQSVAGENSMKSFQMENAAQLSDIFPQDLALSFMEMIRQVIKDKIIQHFEYQLSIENILHDFEARFASSGEDEVLVLIRDMTERLQTERELQESEARYETLANVSPVGIFQTDSRGNTTYVNPTWCQISGLTKEQALGFGWLNAVHEDDRQKLVQNWRQSTTVRQTSLADYRFVHRDGSIVWVVGQAVPELDANHEIVGYVGTITDITERKENEVNLNRAMAAEREALKIFQTIQAANLALSRLLNLPEVLHILLEHLSKIVPFDKANVMLIVDGDQLQVLTEQRIDHDISASSTKNGYFGLQQNPVFQQVITERKSIIIPDLSIYPDWQCPMGGGHIGCWIGVPLIASGKVLGIYTLQHYHPGFYSQKEQQLAEAIAPQAAVAIQNASLHDELRRYANELEARVSERTNELEERVTEVEALNTSMQTLMADLSEAVKKAESADRLKSAFLATMSHELRTPLNSIIGFTGILLQKMVGPLNTEQEKQLRMVQASSHHLLALINDVLDISKIEAGQVDIHAADFDLSVSIQKSIEKVLPMATKKELTLIWRMVPEQLFIHSDQRRVEQILINLLNNAVKFTDDGSVELSCGVDGEMVVIRVQDTGIGISPEKLDSLFIPFRQIDTGLTRKYEGTGLGLSICKRLVDLLGGTIWIESELGKGSAFSFTIPYVGTKNEK